ncbi:MAG: hypothetical protein ACUVT3_10030 [Ignavibacterium sp.]|uniref:hypothetical protein n=1 Tax=Ignavibacterium sp. TaxID=2651167 RepID=UPI00404A8B28
MEENINKKLLDDLKNLPKVSAPDNFEEELWKKIYNPEVKKESFWQKLFSTNKLFPAVATALAIIIIFFLIRPNSSDYEDPFMIEPPVRKDIITVSNDNAGVSGMIEQKQKIEQQELKSDESNRNSLKKELAKQETDSSIRDQLTESTQTPKALSKSANVINDEVQYEIDKEELNFLKRKLTEHEKQEILELKRKIKASDTPKAE